MVMFVTLEEARNHLRVDTTDGDADLTIKIHAASLSIQNYLKNRMIVYEYAMDEYGEYLLDSAGEPYLFEDSNGDYVVRQEVKEATLIMVGVFYIDRDAKEYIEGNDLGRLGNMSLPRVVHYILDPLRKPTVA